MSTCCQETPCQWGDHPCDRKKPICDYAHLPHSGGGTNHGPAIIHRRGYHICQKCNDAMSKAERESDEAYEALQAHPAADRERIYTKADCEAMCEIAVAAVREPLMQDRARLVKALRDACEQMETDNNRWRGSTLPSFNARALLRELGESE